MSQAGDTAKSEYLNLCNQLVEHARLMRDYATTPGNTWLAKSELSKIMQLTDELEKLLENIRQAEA